MRKVEELACLSEWQKKLSRSDPDGGYTGNIYTLLLVFISNLRERSSYWRQGNNPLPKNMKYNT